MLSDISIHELPVWVTFCIYWEHNSHMTQALVIYLPVETEIRRLHFNNRSKKKILFFCCIIFLQMCYMVTRNKLKRLIKCLSNAAAVVKAYAIFEPPATVRFLNESVYAIVHRG